MLQEHQLHLFDLPQHNKDENSHKNYHGKPRLNKAVRDQYEIISRPLDDIIPQNHLARDVWRFVNSLDLSVLLNQILSVEGGQGRSATDPKILLSLWLYATLKSISSARLLEEYCSEHDAYKWLCGGVKVNYHTLSDFRSNHEEQLEELLVQSIAILAQNGLISLEAISQDGMRVRASAGGSSFRREETLKSNLKLATILVSDLKEEAKSNPGACRSRLDAARQRAAEEKAGRIKKAIDQLKEVRKSKVRSGKKKQSQLSTEELKNARTSTTDPDARIMKMADGGFRPAYNVQFASTNKGKAIIAVDVSKSGSDQKQAVNMIKHVEKQYGQVPKKWLIDGGYNNSKELEKMGKLYKTCKIYMPVRITEENKDNPFERRIDDSESVAEWRERMGTEEAKEIYKERAETAEYSNAQARNHGLRQFMVRGLSKVKSVALLIALAHNMTIALNFM